MMSPKILEIKKKQNHKVLFNTHLILCQNDMSHDMVINNHQSLFIGPIRIEKKKKVKKRKKKKYPPWTMVLK